MSLLPAHHRQSLLPELNDLWNAVAPTGLAPMFGAHLLRLEDTIEDGRYIVRAEIPGIDPAKDVEVSVQGRQLTIKAERTEKKEEKGRSEFNYGSFYRSVTLPEGADEKGIEATYAKGILSVSVPMGEPKETPKVVEVKVTD
ncbi:Hsp20/alpha crystallin family protein [Nocardia cyriacigeorgica]|uniref:Hsp20/alpha crystallin family protein n=1 Tax=Nocardia cyriacigeorgica TaxID=135487 RepID=A0A6P1CQB3_9NOCA|nr:Hsp20/alpha crystallin family protein [Nocardia cyriacigeorgica]NEW34087.1 Hsp20/alpha crystallin family protein [Nocardia cyriacigeorgica]